MIILDTHIWLWWVNENIDLIGQVRNDLIRSADIVAVSAISCFEVAWLDAHGRIELPCSRTIWFEKALEGSGWMPILVSEDLFETFIVSGFA